MYNIFDNAPLSQIIDLYEYQNVTYLIGDGHIKGACIEKE